MLNHPQFDPIAFQIGPLAVHWYGLMYLLGFALAWWLGRWRIRHGLSNLTQRQLEDLIFYCVLGIVLGGRLGYAMFYQTGYYLSNPLSLLYLWQGGMSFHGGLLGVLAALWLFARRQDKTFLEIGDTVAPLVPLGLAAGRLGNFINGELWGRATSLPWGMVFPQSGSLLARHPSQLYQMALEGVLLFVLLWVFARKPRPVGQISGLFLMGYGCLRFLVEYTREPDAFLGLLAAGLSMGQWLSLPMLVVGAVIFKAAAKNTAPKNTA